ncbi:MAG: 50S ribosomal protein L30 [Bacillota bacterium]|jgi:large subunit ribosomal protein L30|nr:50S ribosomal protein L30 [Bacillota bacterium]HHU43042.1 50S ribosomal protein L30 [Clostridiales bacterium]
MSKQLKVTLKKSTIGCIKAQKGTVEALGLKKVGSSKVFEDSPALRGMLDKVNHLVEYEEV